MLAASLDINPKALERARKRHRFRNPWYDRRFSGAIRCSLLVVVLVTMTMYLRTNSAAKAAERLNARLHPLLLSRDDDAQYAEEFNFTASLPARKSKKKPFSSSSSKKEAKATTWKKETSKKEKKASSKKDKKKQGDARATSEAVCETGILSEPGDVRACCAPHCGACAKSSCGDAACCAPSILETGVLCRGPFDSQCVWAKDVGKHLAAVADRGMTLPRGEATDYLLDPRSPLATCTTLTALGDLVAQLPVSRRRAYVLHMDPRQYQLGDPARGSYPLAPQLSYLPKRFVIHFGMRLRLRDNTVVLTLGGAITGTRVYCAYVDVDAAAAAAPLAIMLTPFTSVTDIVGHDEADVAAAADAYRTLWKANPKIKEVASVHWNEHRTFERGD